MKKLYLIRNDFLPFGIFGVLIGGNGFLLDTVEHSYAYVLDHTFVPKLPEGIFTCKRGPHRLQSMTKDFETFEVMNVPGHTNILFHVGNDGEKDSEGCVLLGDKRINEDIADSRISFGRFMDFLTGENEFTLEVINAH